MLLTKGKPHEKKLTISLIFAVLLIIFVYLKIRFHKSHFYGVEFAYVFLWVVGIIAYYHTMYAMVYSSMKTIFILLISNLCLYLLWQYGTDHSFIPSFGLGALSFFGSGAVWEIRNNQRLSKKYSTYSLNDTYFQQLGVTVYFQEHRININGTNYNVHDITGWRWVSGNSRFENEASTAIIKLNNISYPIHKIYFPFTDSAENFLQRFDNARIKAGGHPLN